MPGAEERIRRLLREGKAETRPALARHAGVSSVMSGRIVERMVARGEVEEAGLAESGGGRPVMRYRMAAGYGVLAHFRAEAAGHVLQGSFTMTDMQGEALRRSREMNFAMLHAESLDDWLDANARRGAAPLRGIVLDLLETLPPCGLEEHLARRYGCPVHRISSAVALAMQDARDDTLTLYLPRGGCPQGAYRRGGKVSPCGQLHLLPTQVPWEQLDYSDTTAVVESVSRLVLMLTCALAPQRVVLHAEEWTRKLTTRIRFTCATRLERCAQPPRLSFTETAARQMPALMLQAAARM